MKLMSCAAALLVAMAISPAAEAAYCPDTGSARERALCTEPTLTAYDVEMRALYDAAIRALPVDEAARLTDQQDRWSRYLDKICPDGAEDFANCLVGQYISRVRALKAAAMKLGPYLFTRVDIYEAVPGRGKRAMERHAAYPRIVDPKNDAERAWNVLHVRKPTPADCEGRHGDTDTDYEIHLATPRMISVVWTEGFFCDGAPHPYAVTVGRTILLTDTPRPIAPEDLFAAGSDWAARLDRAVRDGVAKAALEKGEEFDPARLDGHASKPENWIPSRDGLVIFFNPRQLGSPGFTPSILIPWSDIADILQPDLGLPPS